ncbi:hypothetical protein Tco_1439538 [Tanacetum coccineum]
MPVAAQQPYIPQPSYEPPAVYQQPPLVYQQPLVVYQQPPVRPTSPYSRFVVPTFLPTDDQIASLNKAMMFLTTAISSRYPPTNNQLKTSSNPRTQAQIQDGRVVCTTKKRVKDSEWFKEKMLLAQQQEAGIEIADEQQDFLADGLEGFDSDCEELQLNATSIPMTKKVDAYDSEVDDTPTTNAIFIAKLSPVGSINGDDVESPASEQLVSVNDTHVDFVSDSNVISDNPYTGTNEDEVVQEMTSLAQNDVAILSLTENMQHEVTRCNTVNQVNEQLTIELDRYRKQIKVLESKKENQLVFTSTEKDLDSQMRKTNC